MPAIRRVESSSQPGEMEGSLQECGARHGRDGWTTGLRPLAIDSSIWGDAARTGGVDDARGSQDGCGIRIEPAYRLGDWEVPRRRVNR